MKGLPQVSSWSCLQELFTGAESSLCGCVCGAVGDLATWHLTYPSSDPEESNATISYDLDSRSHTVACFTLCVRNGSLSPALTHQEGFTKSTKTKRTIMRGCGKVWLQHLSIYFLWKKSLILKIYNLVTIGVLEVVQLSSFPNFYHFSKHVMPNIFPSSQFLIKHLLIPSTIWSEKSLSLVAGLFITL